MQINNNTLFQYPGWAPMADWWDLLPGDLLTNLVDTQYIHRSYTAGCNQWLFELLSSPYGLQPVCPCWHLTLTRHFSSTQLDIFSFLDHCLQTPDIVVCGKFPVYQCLSLQCTHQSNNHPRISAFFNIYTWTFHLIKGPVTGKEKGYVSTGYAFHLKNNNYYFVYLFFDWLQLCRQSAARWRSKCAIIYIQTMSIPDLHVEKQLPKSSNGV